MTLLQFLLSGSDHLYGDQVKNEKRRKFNEEINATVEIPVFRLNLKQTIN